jgi:hypothetical protein
MRDIVVGTALFVLLLITLALPSLPGARIQLASAETTARRTASAEPITSGVGFAVCAADPAWRRPSDLEQRAHLGSDRRFDGLWEAPGKDGDHASVWGAPAVLYDGKSSDGLHWITNLTGLWNVWADATTRPRTCWTEQPQVFLLGYEAVAYDAQDAKQATLRVRAAHGYRIVVLTGPIRPQITLMADRRLDTLDVPSAWVTPILESTGRIQR